MLADNNNRRVHLDHPDHLEHPGPLDLGVLQNSNKTLETDVQPDPNPPQPLSRDGTRLEVEMREEEEEIYVESFNESSDEEDLGKKKPWMRNLI